MIDDSKVLLDFILTQSGITDLADDRVWAEADTPPADYTPGVGPGLCFKRRGGPLDECEVVIWPSYQFKCYGASELIANQLYRALMDALNRRQGDSYIKYAAAEAPGQTLQEQPPKQNWFFVLVYFTVMVIDE